MGRAPERGLAVALPLAALCAAAAPQAEHSRLWGAAGELWDPAGRLPDFSHAGYGRGERPVPEVEAAAHVRDFGARGDGEHDDTEAFRRALQDVEAGAVKVPPGRYLLTDVLVIDRPGIVLRGAGAQRTTLVFPRTLTGVEPRWTATTSGRRTSAYSWSGGFLRIAGRDGGAVVSRVAEDAPRGADALVLEDASDLSPGDEIRLTVRDDQEQSLARYVYAGDPGDISNLGSAIRLGQVFRVRAVEGDRVALDRPLRFDVRRGWDPVVRRFAPTVTRSGIEGLTLEFPATPYGGHFTELGHNGIAISGAAHCWVRDVRIANAESGIFLSGWFTTLTGITLVSARRPDRRGHHGHHGVILGGEDNLLTAFAIEARYIHDITVTRGSIGNVASAGRGVDLSLDHHRRGPYENLFTDLDAGEGARLWASGGGAGLGRHCGARGTFWNLRAARSLVPPGPAFAPAMVNLVGLATDRPGSTEEEGLWFEAIPPDRLEPANLHEAQLRRRSG